MSRSSVKGWSFGRLLALWLGCSLLAATLALTPGPGKSSELRFTKLTDIALWTTAAIVFITPSVVTARWCAAGSHRAWRSGQIVLLWLVIAGIAVIAHAALGSDGTWWLLLAMSPVIVSTLNATWTWIGRGECASGVMSDASRLGATQYAPGKIGEHAESKCKSNVEPDKRRVLRARFLRILIVGWAAALVLLTLGPRAPWRIQPQLLAELGRVDAVQQERFNQSAPFEVLSDMARADSAAASSRDNSISDSWIRFLAKFGRLPQPTPPPPRTIRSECRSPECTYRPSGGISVRIWASADGWQWSAVARDAHGIVECVTDSNQEQDSASNERSSSTSCSLVK